MRILNFLKTNKKRCCKFMISLVVGIVIVSNIEVTYADKATHTIVFNRAEGTEVMLTCKTGSDGRVSSSCASCVANICAKWSNEKYAYVGFKQKTTLYSSKLGDTIFSEDANYYCVAGSSKADGNYCSTVTDACFVCSTNKNVMKWAEDGSSDSACAAGYYETDTPEKDCVTKTACYVCNNDNNIMKWDTNGDSDSVCSSGYTEDTTINQSMCVTKKPVCYVCNDNNNIMKWDTNGDSDSVCSSGYTEDTTINQSMCKTIPDEEIEVEDTLSSKSILSVVLSLVVITIGFGLIYGIKKNY